MRTTTSTSAAFRRLPHRSGRRRHVCCAPVRARAAHKVGGVCVSGRVDREAGGVPNPVEGCADVCGTPTPQPSSYGRAIRCTVPLVTHSYVCHTPVPGTCASSWIVDMGVGARCLAPHDTISTPERCRRMWYSWTVKPTASGAELSTRLGRGPPSARMPQPMSALLVTETLTHHQVTSIVNLDVSPRKIGVGSRCGPFSRTPTPTFSIDVT